MFWVEKVPMNACLLCKSLSFKFVSHESIQYIVLKLLGTVNRSMQFQYSALIWNYCDQKLNCIC